MRSDIKSSECVPETSLKCQAKQLDKLLAEMRAENRFETSLGERNKSKEAYATALYSDGINKDFYM